ncbi:MAG: hypothetical protein V7603_24 [Micromonosporaceae bacterium]
MAEETRPGEIHNSLYGGATGSVAQVGTVHGGIHFHDVEVGGAPLRVPRQLPVPPANFVGRGTELAELDKAAARCGLILITGTAGIGKSALVLHWARRIEARFPDGQLYANLGAFDPAGPTAPAEILGLFLRALGVPVDRVPPQVAEQSALFRSVTADRKLLVLLDNAVSAAQARQLLPAGPGCLVVVTSRWRLAGLISDGARFLAIEALDDRAATELLCRTAGAARVAADATATASLVRLCAGLPLALSVTAARLAAHPQWTVRRVAAELADEQVRLARLCTGEDQSVQATFDLSYRSLPPDVARCYRALGLHPGTRPSIAVIAAALGTPPERAGESLDTLVEASLLDDVSDDRYQMHDLVRLHARQRALDDPEHEVLAARIAGWYLDGARAAGAVLTPYRRGTDADRREPAPVLFADRDSALEWLERERTNLVAAVVATADPAPELSWRLAHAMWPLFHLRRHYADRMVVERVAVRCARQLGNVDYEARALRRLGFAHFDTGQVDEASRLFEESLRLCRRLSNRYGESAALGGLGVVAMAQRRFAAAAGYFAQNLAVCQALGQRRMAALALFRLGKVSNRSGQPARAVDHLARAGEMFADLDAYNRARVRVELGRGLAGLGLFEDGARELDGALADMHRLDSPSGRAQVHHALGELRLAAGDPAGARPWLAEALRVYEQLGDVEADGVRALLASVPPAGSDPQPAA